MLKETYVDTSEKRYKYIDIEYYYIWLKKIKTCNIMFFYSFYW